MKVYIDKDERYPDYGVSSEPTSSPDGVLEVPEAVFKKWRRIAAAYERMQEEIKKLMKED